MIGTIKRTAGIAAVFSLLPFVATAATLSSVEVIQVQGPDPFSPMSSATVVEDNDSAIDGTASVSIGGFSGDSVSATQNADGTSEVSTETGRDANTELSSAVASLLQTETNTTGADRLYTLDYELSGLTTRLFHASDLGLFGNPGATPSFVNPFADDLTELVESNYTAASFQYDILVNGSSVFSARADALANEAGVTTENVSEFEVTITEGLFGSTLFEVGDISGTIELGVFGDGETLEVESILTARSYSTNIFDEITNSVGARSTDPVTVSSVGFIQSTAVTTPDISAVPLPAAGWMLLAGIGGLAAMNRRKKA